MLKKFSTPATRILKRTNHHASALLGQGALPQTDALLLAFSEKKNASIVGKAFSKLGIKYKELRFAVLDYKGKNPEKYVRETKVAYEKKEVAKEKAAEKLAKVKGKLAAEEAKPFRDINKTRPLNSKIFSLEERFNKRFVDPQPSDEEILASDLTKIRFHAEKLANEEEAPTIDSYHLFFAFLELKLGNGWVVFDRELAIRNISITSVKLTLVEMMNQDFANIDESWKEASTDTLSGTINQRVRVTKTGLTEVLDANGENLTETVRQAYKKDPISGPGVTIGRDFELDRIIQVLGRRTKNNPVLLGDAGVGKTAIIEAFAQKIVLGGVPDGLRGNEIFALDVPSVMSNSSFRGEFENTVMGVMSDLKALKKVILFIDELHMIVGMGQAEGESMDFANLLKPELARGDIRCIGATTTEEYRKFITKDAALERRFQPITIKELTVDDTREILFELRVTLERYHRVLISEDAIEQACQLANKYLIDRSFPDKAIDILDETSARISLEGLDVGDQTAQLRRKLIKYRYEREDGVRLNTGESLRKAADARILEERCRIELAEETARVAKARAKKSRERGFDSIIRVTGDDVALVVSSAVKMPVTTLTDNQVNELRDMEDRLHERIVSQDEAVRAVSRALRRARLGIRQSEKPIGSFIFTGPTGTGKTELTKALAAYYYGSEKSMIRFDMSEYVEKISVSKLIGSPRGYVGSAEGGQLTEGVRRKPYTVLLFDEIEKAHPQIYDIFLQILDDGRCSDSKGRSIDFKQTVIIYTSNVGVPKLMWWLTEHKKVYDPIGKCWRRLKPKPYGGYTKDEADLVIGQTIYDKLLGIMKRELLVRFRPEFINRLDELVVFSALRRMDTIVIAGKLLGELNQRLNKKGIELEYTEFVPKLLVEQGFNRLYGARPIIRTLRTLIEDGLSNEILGGNLSSGDKVFIAEWPNIEPRFQLRALKVRENGHQSSFVLIEDWRIRTRADDIETMEVYEETRF